MSETSTIRVACAGLCAERADDQTAIPCGDASAVHGVCVRHSVMPTNGEQRFRLNSRHDGTAYIRTVTAATASGWQNPHFHDTLRETYIVERGWIGYAELRDGAVVFRRCVPGDVFTTSPRIVHNIYMSANSVIHTVKHAAGALAPDAPTDWLSGTPECEQLRRATQGDFPADAPRLATAEQAPATPTSAATPLPRYGDDYRHFDTLVWQVPAWASALFAAVMVSINSFLTPGDAGGAPGMGDPSANMVASLFSMSRGEFAATQLLLFGAFSLILGYALYRFRWHQTGTRAWSAPASGLRLSPQAWLQYMVNAQTALMLFVGGVLAGVPRGAAGVIVLAMMSFITWYWDWQIVQRNAVVHGSDDAIRLAQRREALRGAS